jgi:cell division protein FtsL
MSAVAPTRARRRPENRPTRREPGLRLVEPERGRRSVLYALFIAILCALAVFATVTSHALAAADALRTHDLERELADAERRYAALTAEVAALERPGRIEEVATEDLGMVAAATTSRFVVLERPLPDDRAGDGGVVAGEQPDPLKPVLSAEH